MAALVPLEAPALEPWPQATSSTHCARMRCLRMAELCSSCGIERQALPLQYMVRLSMLPVQGGHSFKRRAP